MRSWLCAGLLLPAVLCSREAWAYERCPLARLRAGDQAQIDAAVTRLAGRATEPGLIIVCRGEARAGYDIYVWVQTPRESQPDGAARWHSGHCGSYRNRRGGWVCTLWPYRGFHLKPYADVPGVWVEIEAQELVIPARGLAERAFLQLEGTGEARACEPDEGEPRSFAALKMWLTEGDGVVGFRRYPGGMALSHVLLEVHFDVETPDAAPRIRCWGEAEVVVTSQR